MALGLFALFHLICFWLSQIHIVHEAEHFLVLDLLVGHSMGVCIVTLCLKYVKLRLENVHGALVNLFSIILLRKLSRAMRGHLLVTDYLLELVSLVHE